MQAAEIIALLYEATQAPLSLDDAPALNPTGGVRGKQQLARLSFQKDGTRPGGGVFVAKGPIADSELLETLPDVLFHLQTLWATTTTARKTTGTRGGGR